MPAEALSASYLLFNRDMDDTIMWGVYLFSFDFTLSLSFAKVENCTQTGIEDLF